MTQSPRPAYFDMHNKTVLVVGSTGGIGSAFTKLALDSGASVISASRKPERSNEMGFSLQPIGEEIKKVELDLADSDSVDKAIRILISLDKPIDAIVFAAGASHGALTQLTRGADLRRVFEVNALGPFRLLQGISRKLSENASCVFVSSVSSVLPQRGSTIYGASKAALERMALGFALELGERKIRVNILRPGPVETEMLALMDPANKDDLLERSFNKATTSPSEIANLIGFLVSDISIPLTGTVLTLDGGW